MVAIAHIFASRRCGLLQPLCEHVLALQGLLV